MSKILFLPKAYYVYTPSEPINRPTLAQRRSAAQDAKLRRTPQSKMHNAPMYRVDSCPPVRVMLEGVELGKYRVVGTSTICYAHNEMHAKHLMKNVVNGVVAVEEVLLS